MTSFRQVATAIMLCGLLAITPSALADRVLAQGQYAQLTEDNGKALLEATRFMLDQLGASQLLANVDDAQALQEMARVFPQASAEEQQTLSQARQYWTQAQTQWPRMSMTEKRAFAFDVLTLSLGSSTANQLLGGSPAAGQSSPGSSDSYSGMPSVDSGYEGSGCWASAGCTGYESDTGTYNYESYDSGSGSYSDY
ncbi:MAG: hypothetical protein H7A00_06230 [Hahellaceae bacterium]|nr:hypothetical protein [Hahellaceae bacterium]